MRICIDPGHGGTDPGAIGIKPFQLRETDFNLAVALLLEEQLLDRGFEVLLTRRQNRTLTLSEGAWAESVPNLDIRGYEVLTHKAAAGAFMAWGTAFRFYSTSFAIFCVL